ncbi:MAG: nucleotide-binding protein [Polyangiales bacterium]|nr:nucleotide-binding protein [Myxococcales bacterium]
MTSEKGIGLLETILAEGQALLDAGRIDSDRYSAWTLKTRNYLEKAFGVGSPNVSSIMETGTIGAFVIGGSEREYERERRETLSRQLAKMPVLIDVLKTESELQRGNAASQAVPTGHGVFLVHGHDERHLDSVARFLEKFVRVTILREQPNKGRTIIEKFESYADVGFAVVLLTPDDLGGAAEGNRDAFRARARQNVILELGYFLGRLGRARVCALYVDGVEIPSDYAGVLFVPLDESGNWKLLLAKELRAAEFPIDLNEAL